ncbi:MAG: dihydroorotate dehydrogenase [Candidatus Methylomirabilia bacterium]
MVRVVDAIYRMIYRGVLCQLPEPRAVALGQSLLRHLPLDRFPLFRLTDPRLAVALGGVRLPNPLILSSMYYDLRILRRAMGLGFGAVTTKSITVNARPGHPEPTLVRIDTASGAGLINCNGFKNPGLEVYRRELPGLPHRVPLIVAVAGESIEEYVRLVEALALFGELVEINISSPNTALVYQWSQQPEELRALFKGVRAVTDKPLIVKVSPDFHHTNEEVIIPLALDHGIRIVHCGNTRRVSEPRLSQGAGGLSGPELFPRTVENVRQLRARFGDQLEIIGTGGVNDPEKALALLRAGATACGYFTGFITRGPILARLILDRLLHECDQQGATRLAQLRRRA